MAEITSVTSEVLQAKIREILPSQKGFGEDLQAQNVIVPIVDLTAAAQGTDVPLYQQQALAFGSQTTFVASNATDTIANTAGFYRIYGAVSLTSGVVYFTLSDGISTKIIWQINNANTSDTVDFVVFLRSGDSLTVTSSATTALAVGSSRQVADVNGSAVLPSGFTPQ